MSFARKSFQVFLALCLSVLVVPSFSAFADEPADAQDAFALEEATVDETADESLEDEASVEESQGEDEASDSDEALDSDAQLDVIEIDADSVEADGEEALVETPEDAKADDPDDDLETLAGNAHISYSTHVQTYGWMDFVQDGEMSGTSGQSKRLEAIKINLSGVSGGVTYRVHAQTYGWLDNVTDGEMSGTSGQSKRLEAIEISLTGTAAQLYDVYYRVHIQNFGWLDWACNGEAAGSQGFSKRLEGIEILLVEKGDAAPGATGRPFIRNWVNYVGHIQNIGWDDEVSDGETLGYPGEGLRMEAMEISLGKGISGGIEYRSHVQGIGWMDMVSDGEMSGTSGQSRRIEAVQIALTGNIAQTHDVYYRVYAESFGWLDWAKNGQSAGTASMSDRLEGLQIVVQKKSAAAPGDTAYPFIQPVVQYSAFQRSTGSWSDSVSNGAICGLTGESSLEAIKVTTSGLNTEDSVEYRVHMQTYGWLDWVSAGKAAGKPSSNKRLEALQIELTGKAAEYFDIYYRVYCDSYGWLGWACNGEEAGSMGLSLPAQAVQIKIVKSGASAPGSTYMPYLTKESLQAGSALSLTLDEMVDIQWDAAEYVSDNFTKKEVKSLINPDSYKVGTSQYYQFALLTTYTGLTPAQLDAFIESTASGRSGKLKGMGVVFVAAAKKYNINEVYLLSHAILESGWGTSTLASGYNYNGKTKVNGTTYPKGTYYNFYGIGAVDSGPLAGGRALAIKNGWDSPEKAIMGAAEWIGKNYIYGNTNGSQLYDQNTLYKMRWNYEFCDKYDYMSHLYATDPQWPTSIAKIMGNCYTKAGVTPSLTYIVPRYKTS